MPVTSLGGDLGLGEVRLRPDKPDKWGHIVTCARNIIFMIPGVTMSHLLCCPRLVVSLKWVNSDLVRSLPMIKCLGQLRPVLGWNHVFIRSYFFAPLPHLWDDNIVCSNHWTTPCSGLHCSEQQWAWRGHQWRCSPEWPLWPWQWQQQVQGKT